jgi:hypothetical protein
LDSDLPMLNLPSCLLSVIFLLLLLSSAFLSFDCMYDSLVTCLMFVGAIFNLVLHTENAYTVAGPLWLCSCLGTCSSVFPSLHLKKKSQSHNLNLPFVHNNEHVRTTHNKTTPRSNCDQHTIACNYSHFQAKQKVRLNEALKSNHESKN